MNPSDFYRKTLELLEAGRAGWMITVIAAEGSTPQKAGAKMLVAADGGMWGTIGGGDVERMIIEHVLKTQPQQAIVVPYTLTDKGVAAGGPDMTCGGTMNLLVEPLAVYPHLYILGGGHCGIELSHLAARTGFAVTVMDNRTEWASREKHPDARVICAPYSELETHVRFSPDCSVVIMTHNHEHDEAAARLCVKHETRFLGVIGSKNKARTLKSKLAQAGISAADLERITCPVGVEIGSHTPAEIAVSVVAQLIAVRNAHS
jgi:xanthine dehydrogenase accessory factor